MWKFDAVPTPPFTSIIKELIEEASNGERKPPKPIIEFMNFSAPLPLSIDVIPEKRTTQEHIFIVILLASVID